MPLLLLLPVLALSLMSAVVPPFAHADSDARAKAAELDQLRSRISGLRRQLDRARGQQSEAEAALQKVETAIAAVGQALHALERDISQGEQGLRELGKQRQALEREMLRDREQLAGQVRASYAMGRQEQLKILLNQGDPATLQRTLVYYDYLNRARSRRITEALERLQRLESLEVEIQRKQQSLQTLRDRQRQQQEQLESRRLTRREVLAALGSEITDKDRQLQDLQRDERELQQVLEALEFALADIPPQHQNRKPFPSLKGQLPWPAGGRIVASFGSPRPVGKLRWRGVLIAAERGQKVRAVAHGRVAFADWMRGYGLLMIIDHGDGYMSLYGQNQSLYKEVGEWVQPGEVIASVGDSGGQDDAGVYFEIRGQGAPVDPARWCQKVRGKVISVRR